MRGSKLDARTQLLLIAVGTLAIATIVATPRWARAQDVLTLRGPGSTIGATLQGADVNSLAGATRGAVVGAVQVGSPAATAGIRVGDLVTRNADSEPPRSTTHDAFPIHRAAPGGRRCPENSGSPKSPLLAVRRRIGLRRSVGCGVSRDSRRKRGNGVSGRGMRIIAAHTSEHGLPIRIV
jgi:hypothetical protein